jgi:hypothetical protein
MEVNDNAVLFLNDTELGSWKRQRGTYFDQKRLRAEQPDVIKQYTVEHHYRAFRLKKQKGQK